MKETSKCFAEKGDYQGLEVIRLAAGNYDAIIAHTLGGNVIRLHERKHGVEVFRFNENKPIAEVADSIEIWGLPTMYLPNRHDAGILRTSDAVYQLPVNEPEPYNNNLHGFLHRRAYSIAKLRADDETAYAEIFYDYDENDEFFKYLPIAFTARLCFELSSKGLAYTFSLVNNSDKQLPVSVATHTTINAPFVDGAKQEDIRLAAPIGKRCVLNDRCLPTGELAELTDWDKEYLDGTKKPVLQVVNNDMYYAETLDKSFGGYHGVRMTDTASGISIRYETSEEYGFWIFWNQWGFEGYFCPEPMTAMINAANLDVSEPTGYRELEPEQIFTCRQWFSVEA